MSEKQCGRPWTGWFLPFSSLEMISLLTFHLEITTDTHGDDKGPTWITLGSAHLSYRPVSLHTQLWIVYTAVTAWVVSLTGEDEDQYEQFMLPLTAAFEAVAQMFSTNSFNEQEAKVRPSPADRPASASWQPLTETRLASTAEDRARPYTSTDSAFYLISWTPGILK